MFDPVHLEGIDTMPYAIHRYYADVVLLPINSSDPVFLSNWRVYYCYEIPDSDDFYRLAFYVPFWGQMWPVQRIHDTLYLCDSYVI